MICSSERKQVKISLEAIASKLLILNSCLVDRPDRVTGRLPQIRVMNDVASVFELVL
jgi:hypothetical protein